MLTHFLVGLLREVEAEAVARIVATEVAVEAMARIMLAGVLAVEKTERVGAEAVARIVAAEAAVAAGVEAVSEAGVVQGVEATVGAVPSLGPVLGLLWTRGKGQDLKMTRQTWMIDNGALRVRRRSRRI